MDMLRAIPRSPPRYRYRAHLTSTRTDAVRQLHREPNAAVTLAILRICSHI
jgi:hypothetical protein